MYQQKNTYHLKSFMKMHERCPVCGQPLDMEPGFYYGTNMVSYTLAVLISIATFFLWWVTIGFSLSDKRFFWWIGINAVSGGVAAPADAHLAHHLAGVLCALQRQLGEG